jgi:polar amino acid transport system permease protein
MNRAFLLKRLFLAPQGREHENEGASWLRGLFAWLPALIIVGLIFAFSFHQLSYRWNWPSVYRYRRNLLFGWWVTIGISLVSLVLSTIIGLGFALARRSRLLPLRNFGHLYVESVRGTPLLVQILIFFYVVADAFHVENRYLAGILILSFFSGAYLSEVIRAGIESVGQTQIESARAIGLTRSQTYRHVILPQALRVTMPPLVGQFISLIKDSSLLSIIAVNEFTQAARDVNSVTFSTLECYLPLAAGYLVLTLPLSLWLRAWEKKLRFET